MLQFHSTFFLLLEGLYALSEKAEWRLRGWAKNLSGFNYVIATDVYFHFLAIMGVAQCMHFCIRSFMNESEEILFSDSDCTERGGWTFLFFEYFMYYDLYDCYFYQRASKRCERFICPLKITFLF